MSTPDSLLDSLPSLVTGASPSSPRAALVAGAAGGVDTAQDTESVMTPTGAGVVVETVTSPTTEYEGKRPAAGLIGDFEGEAGADENVTFVKPSPPMSSNKTTRVTWLQKHTCSKFCLGCLSKRGGLQKFCMELRDENGKCSLKSHAEKPKMEIENGFYVITETTAGRGGATAYATKFLPDELVTSKQAADMMNRRMTVTEWDEFFKTFKVAKVTGNEIGDVKDLDKPSGYKLLQALYTPQKAVTSREIEDDNTILDTPESWEEVFTTQNLGEALRDPVAELPRDPTSVLNMSGFVQKGFAICRDNFNLVSDSMDSVGNKASSTFSEVFQKLNQITLSLHTLAEQVGTYEPVAGVDGIATVFESLSVLDSRIELGDKALLDLTDTLTKTQSKVDEVEFSKAEVDQKWENAKKRGDELHEQVKEMQEATAGIKRQQKKMVDKYLHPMIIMYNDFMGVDMTGCNFMDRVKRMEQTVRRIADDADLFGSISMTGIGAGAAGEDLSTTLNRISTVEEINVGLRKELDELKEMVKAGNSGGAEAPGGIAEEILERVVLLEEYRGPGIVLAGTRFDGPGSCEQFLRSQLAWDDNKPFYANDWISMIHSVPKEDGVVTIEVLMARDHHTTKGGFSNLSAAKSYASAQQSVPGMLAGTAEHPIPGAKTYDKYDHQDGIKGIRYEITRGVDHRGNALMSLMQRDLRSSPIALSVFTALVLNAQIHWKTFAAFLSDLRNITYHQCHDATESWLYACEVGRGVLDECYKLRHVGSERSNMKEFTIQDAARLMWGMLQTHNLMEEFLKYKFLGHPNLSSYSINHLFRNRVTPSSLGTVKGEVQKLVSRVAALDTSVGKHETRLAALSRKGKE